MDKTIVKYTHCSVFPIVILEVHNVFYNIGRNRYVDTSIANISYLHKF